MCKLICRIQSHLGNPEGGGTENWTKSFQLNISTFSYFFISLFSCCFMFFVLISIDNSLFACFYKDKKVLKKVEIWWNLHLTDRFPKNTSYIPAGQGAPKAWKRWGEQWWGFQEVSVCSHNHLLSLCYNGCVSGTTPLPTPQLGAEAAHSDPFPIPNHPMASCSFDFRKFYRVGSEIMEHQPLH